MPQTMGERIREARKEKDGGMTLAEVAEECEFSVSYLSQLERDKLEPSLSSLKKIANALGVSAVSLMFGEENQLDPAQVVHEEDRKTVEFPEGDISYDLLTPDLQGSISVLKLEAPPESHSGPEAFKHEGEDVAVILEGSLVVEVDEEEYRLESGDSIRFNSRLPHRWRNPNAETVRAIWISTPPSF